MTRRPGYDIDGQPTKVDPRDFPDPLQVDPDGEPQRGDPPRPARGDWGCSVFAVAVLLALLAGCSAQPAGTAEDFRAGSYKRETIHLTPAMTPTTRRAPASFVYPAGEDSAPADIVAAPNQPEVLAGGTTYSGIIGYAEPGLGRYYLAIPDGRGIRVEICGPAACLIRVSTDAGPDLAMQRAGRIADLNWLDWQTISGVPLRYGLTQGTVLILERPAAIPLPATDLEGP